ncbi:MAG TPA: 5'-nucleotidase C-terminal domain-containing protein [Chitinophagaceae bacterium]|nr:5'-nucleotidase C-terminal domain-containing protein [Chitinophagaceae bacterium]
MKKIKPFPFLLFLLITAGLSCNTSYQTQSLQYKGYRVNDAQPKDASVQNFLQPYSDNVNKTMNDVVGVAPVAMDKKLPESTLGNFMTDAFLTMAAEKYDTKTDAAILNYGGMRLTQLPAGNVTTGKIFELMPFDNLLILQKLKGDVLLQLLDLAAAKGGWPVAGITMQIKDKKAVNVMVGGKPLDPSATYTLVNSDFLANGGDNAEMLRNVPQITNGYLMRDAILDYIKKLKEQGKTISANIENRVTNAQ